MKARTAKRLAILILVLSLVGVAGFFTQRYQVDRLARKELEKAELACKEGDFAKAEALFRAHVQVFPEDLETQIKRADVLLKVSRSRIAQNEANQIYSGILKRFGGREDVRRSLIDLKFDMGQLISNIGRDDGADIHLKILLKTPGKGNNPHLLYLMGRCDEERRNDPIAVENAMQSYRKVVETKGAPDRIDAGERLATLLLHAKPSQSKEARAVINKLVEDDQDDYRGYLARGRFWLNLAASDPSQKSLESDAKKDFEKAAKLAPTEPDVYLQQFRTAVSEGKSGYDRARRLLKEGLKKIPTSKEIYESLADVEIRAGNGNLNAAIEVLELGVKGIELRTPMVKDVSRIPANGKNLIIVAVVEKVLHFRIFDAEGNVAVDTDETKLAEQAQKIKDLRTRLESLWSSQAQELTKSDRDLIVTAVASIVGDTRWVGQTDQSGLRLLLTELLARNGDTGKLRLHIEELKNVGYPQMLIQYFTAWYHINANEFVKARQILVALQPAMNHKFKSKINVLLAQCYRELGEPEMQQNAYLLALSADPQDPTAKLGWIKNLIDQGDIAGAIREYRVLVKQVPQVRPMLARLLIVQNQRRPESQRNWNEVNELINYLPETESQVVELTILRAQLLFAQGEKAAARDKLEEAIIKFPKSVDIRIAQVDLTAFQGRVDEALSLLEQAEKQLGDQVDLRLERAKLWASKKGPEFRSDLMDLSQNAEKFFPADRKRLLNGLAIEFVRAQDLDAASIVWGRLAKENPADIELRLKLLDLALQNIDNDGYDLRLISSANDVSSMPREGKNLIVVAAVKQVLHIRVFDNSGELVIDIDEEDVTDKVRQMEDFRKQLVSLWPPHEITGSEKNRLVTAVTSIIGHPQIEKYIKQIEQIEGNEGLQGRYCQVQYLIWQARRAGDKDAKRAIQHKAQVLLEDLESRRGDWSVIPLASAELAQQELDQDDLKGEELRAKEERLIGFYRQAIKLGQRRAAVVRRTVELLFKNGQGDSALELLSSIPMESQLAGWEYQAARLAVENKDFQHAEQIARKAVQANPEDFQERIWLVQILLASDRQSEAEKELRDAVDLSRGDPDRWIALVTFLISKQQPVQAEKVIRDAEAKLLEITPSKAPIALALCCEKMARAHDGNMDQVAEVKRWNDEARAWYEKAQAAKPEDLSIKRRLTEFFLQSRQIEEAKKYLEVIRRQSAGAKNTETTTWANRAFALILANGTDPTQLSKALAIFEPDEQPVRAGQEGKILEHKNRADPEDLRVLAQVLDMQKTLVHRKRAIEILENLANKYLATSEDRFFIARLYETIGDWPKAREKYRELNLRTKTLRDMETLNRRPVYLAHFVNYLLQHLKPGDTQDLADAQEYVDEIKQLQPEALATLFLQVEIYRIRNEVDQAGELIEAFANHPNVTPQLLETLARKAENIKQIPLADRLYRRQAILAGTIRSKLLLAAFLGRHDQAKEGLSICEPLWTNSQEIKVVGNTCIEILFGSDGNTPTTDPAQIDRVAGWFEQAIAREKSQKPSNPWLFAGLGNLRERQRQFSTAEHLYHTAVQEDDRDAVSLNNLAWLIALEDKKRVKEALGYANRAIALKPDQADFLDTRGMVYLIDAQPTLALGDFQRAVAIDPSSPSKHFHLAQAFLANNDKERGRQSLDAARAKKLTPSSLHDLERPNYQSVLNALGSP